GGSLSVRLVEDAKRKQPQHGSGKRYDDSIASTLYLTLAQGREDADRAEPAHHVIANRDNWRLFRLGGGPFDTEQARYRPPDLTEAERGRPRAFLPVGNDTCVDQSGLFFA